jgi:RNA polymerase primary sigma factor
MAVFTTDAVRDYLSRLGRTSLLTAQQEVELAERIEAGRLAQERLDATPAAAEREELQRLVTDGRQARDHMVEANLRLVVSIAKRYAAAGMPLLDLIQEGTIGMMRAVEKFDHRRGLKFSTYATFWIKQAIGKALADQGRTIRLPGHAAELLNRVTRARRAMVAELGREPSAAELAAALDLPVEKVALVLRLGREPISLHTAVDADGTTELGDLLPDDAPDVLTTIAAASRRRDLAVVLATLPEREAAVISQRFGLTDDQPRTLDEIGRRYGLTRERIRQIEAKGMSKLRQPARARELADLLV